MSRLVRRYRLTGRHRPASVPPTVQYARGRATVYGGTPVDPWAGSGYVFHWSEV